jgi:hypothetical protein
MLGRMDKTTTRADFQRRSYSSLHASSGGNGFVDKRSGTDIDCTQTMRISARSCGCVPVV